jgi:pilus assembly protein CpaF
MINDGSWSLVKHYLTPIRHLFEMPGITEIEINRFDRVFIEKNGRTEFLSDVRFDGEDEVVTLIYQIANALGQPVDKDNPILDARLVDGTRVCGVLYPVSTEGSSISFRIFPKERITADKLVYIGSLSQEMLDFLRTAMICRANVLISGGTGSGKTTLLNALTRFIPADERVLTVEDTRELNVNLPNFISLEAPMRRRETDGPVIDMSFLIRTTLRLNPDRIIVGEIRDAQAATAFLHAVNTGHTACSTIHSNSADDALTRIQTLVAGHGDLPFDVVKFQVRSNLNLLIHAERTPHHGRRVVCIAEIKSGEPVNLWRWSYRRGEHIKEDVRSIILDTIEKFAPPN